MDMVQIFLDIGELEQAQSLFDRLPEADRNSDTGRALFGQITFRNLAAKTEGKEVLQARVDANADDHDARFDLAICLVAEHQYQQAIDELFTIFEKEPGYKEGAAREMIVNLTNRLALTDPELAQTFRRRLGSALA
jgi:putative thioredoxin